MPSFEGETYPESTSILCWHCCHSFETRPLPMPVSYSKSRYRVYGVFCSFGCMNGYLRDNRHSIPGSSSGSIGMTVFDFFKAMTGCRDPRKIPKAPPRCALKAFGGYMSIEEFRASSTGPEPLEFVRVPPKCILTEQVYHERRQSMSHTRSSPAWSHAAMIKNRDDLDVPVGETLKIKRKYQVPAPQKKKRTILEQALGIA